LKTLIQAAHTIQIECIQAVLLAFRTISH
jgi:hypothetical protein